MVHAVETKEEPVDTKCLADYTNSIHENFFGVNVNIIKLVNKESGEAKILSTHRQKMGPIPLNPDHRTLMEAWEQVVRSELADSKLCETWVKDPPNVLMFNLNRVKFDTASLRVMKNDCKFTFDKKIHID